MFVSNTQEVDSEKVSRAHGSMRLPTRCVIIVNSFDRASTGESV